MRLTCLRIGNSKTSNHRIVKVETSKDSPLTAGQGLIGLGPSSGSNVFKLLNDTDTGLAPLDSIFRQNTSTPNFLSITLSRDLGTQGNDIVSISSGQLSIGSVIEGFESITSQRKLPVPVDPYKQQHWLTFLDADGFTGPDGQTVTTLTAFSDSLGPHQLKTVFDSGFSLPQVPGYLSDAIYGRVPGAVFVDDSSSPPGYWTVPCNYELNVSFVFGGVRIPIHPLDLTVPFDSSSNIIGNNTCMGTVRLFT